MENVLFTRSSTPSDEPIVDGQLIFDTSGTGKMYLDNGTDRLEMGGAMNVDSTLSKTSTNPIQNKAVAGVMLENLTDIDTVTTSGFLTDALATKELHTEVNEINSNLKSNTIYISDEVEIGTWMGKPLYRKAYSGTGSITNQFTVDASINTGNIDEIVIVNGSATDGSVILQIPYLYGTSDFLSVYVTSGGIQLFRVGSVLNKFSMIIEYTKKE